MPRSTRNTPPTGVFVIPVTSTGKPLGELTRIGLNPKGQTVNDLVHQAAQAALVGPDGWVKLWVAPTNARGRAVMYGDGKFLGMCRQQQPVG